MNKLNLTNTLSFSQVDDFDRRGALPNVGQVCGVCVCVCVCVCVYVYVCVCVCVYTCATHNTHTHTTHTYTHTLSLSLTHTHTHKVLPNAGKAHLLKEDLYI